MTTIMVTAKRFKNHDGIKLLNCLQFDLPDILPLSCHLLNKHARKNHAVSINQAAGHWAVSHHPWHGLFCYNVTTLPRRLVNQHEQYVSGW